MKDQFGDLVQLQRRHDGVAVLSIRNPPVNALVTPVFAELRAAAEALKTDLPGAVVITGLPKAFALGGEISEVRRQQFDGRDDIPDEELDAAVAATIDPEYVASLGRKYHETFEAVATIPRMVIAAIEGIAFGGGLELALACDYRIVSERARLASPEVTLGATSIGAGTIRMTHLIGPSKTKRMYLGGVPVTAAEALEMGLVDEVTPTGSTVDRALAFAAQFAAGAVHAQGMFKTLVDASLNVPFQQALDLEFDLWCESFRSEDARIGLRAFFKNGPNKPVAFTGR